MDINDQEVEFPEALHFLITTPSRYKILYGGRGGSKTESIALALVILGSEKRLRIACFREFQSSISESVHAIIKQKIYDIHREDEWNITDKSIISKRTGTEFIFSGLRYNIDKIKSMSRIDIAWVEEARNVSKTSWDKLGPTIRGRYKDDPNGQGGPFGEGPEIWVSFNPELAGDETYKRFILKPPSEYDVNGKRYSIIKKVNWTDNKFFPADLRAEMEELKLKDQDKYLEVWEGHTKIVLDGAIYADEIKEVLLSNPSRRGKVPYNSSKPVFTCWDLGHSDKTAIWFIQKIGMEFNLIHYYENSLKKMPFYIKYLQEAGYVYEKHYLPHDGDAETLSNVTPKKQLKDANLGDVRIVKRPSKKFVGINAVRSVFPLCNFDEDNTADGWQCLTNYCYKVDPDTGSFSKEPDHDTPWSHGADAMQTFCLSLKTETESNKVKKTVSERNNFRPSSDNWMV